MRRRVFWSIGLAVIAIPILLVVLSPRRQPEPLPSPNGYDDLLGTAASVVSNPGDWRTQHVEQLQAVLAPNSNAMAIIRDALKKEWAVPISYGPTSMNLMMPNLTATKALAQLFCAQGRWAELEQRTNDAVITFVECIQLGQKAGQGGLVLHEQVGIACKAIGNRAMQNSWPAANDTTLVRVLDSLSEIDRYGNRVEETIRRDRNWARSSYSMLRYACVSFVMKSTTRDVEAHFRTRRLRSEVELRLLRTDIAIELFRRQHAHPPAILSELVPRFLEAVPLDPFSARPLLYRPTTNSYLLYSVGPDKKDDGGVALTNVRQGPLLFDADSDRGDIVSKPPLRL